MNTLLKTTVTIVLVLLAMLLVSKLIWKQPLNYSDFMLIAAGAIVILVTWFKTK